MSAISDYGFELVDHPHYFPDLASLGLLSLPQHEKILSGKRYQSDDEVTSAVEEVF